MAAVNLQYLFLPTSTKIQALSLVEVTAENVEARRVETLSTSTCSTFSAAT